VKTRCNEIDNTDDTESRHIRMDDLYQDFVTWIAKEFVEGDVFDMATAILEADSQISTKHYA
jgi:hypothetical protein